MKSHSLCNKFRKLSLSLSLCLVERQNRSSRYLTNFFHEYDTIFFWFFLFSFFLSFFFHSGVIDTTIRNTGRPFRIRFRIERNERWDNLARDRESCCKISIKFMRWIDDSRDSSWKLGRRKARTTLLERMVDQETKRDRSWPFNVSVLSPVIYHRGSIAVPGSSDSAVSFLRGNIDTRACDLYGEIESAIIESPHGGMEP